jgi:hypothetical protein
MSVCGCCHDVVVVRRVEAGWVNVLDQTRRARWLHTHVIDKEPCLLFLYI